MIWAGSEQELLDFMSDLNKKLLQSNSNLSTQKFELLDVLVYKDHNNMLQTTIYRKQTDKITLMLDQTTQNR